MTCAESGQLKIWKNDENSVSCESPIHLTTSESRDVYKRVVLFELWIITIAASRLI